MTTNPIEAPVPQSAAPFTFHGQRKRPPQASTTTAQPRAARLPAAKVMAHMASRPRLSIVPDQQAVETKPVPRPVPKTTLQATPLDPTLAASVQASDTDDLGVRFTGKARQALTFTGMSEREAAEMVADPDIVTPDDNRTEGRAVHYAGNCGFICSIADPDGFIYVLGIFERNHGAGEKPRSLEEVARSQPRYAGAGNAAGTMPTSFDEIADRVKATPGWDVEEGRGKHPRHIVSLDGRHRQPIPSSSSDFRAIRNCVAQLRAMGLDVRRPVGKK